LKAEFPEFRSVDVVFHIEKAIENHILANFHGTWYSNYLAYKNIVTEIFIVSFISIAVAIVCFSIAVYYMQKRYKASKIEAYT